MRREGRSIQRRVKGVAERRCRGGSSSLTTAPGRRIQRRSYRLLNGCGETVEPLLIADRADTFYTHA